MRFHFLRSSFVELVNLHIIGAQKCGTTALAHFLHQHPSIYVLDGKESHVFDNPQFLRSQTKMAYAKEAFAKRMKHYKDETFLCDATPITWYNPRFLKHCYNYNTKAKFIVLLRCPVQRAISHYKMSLNKGQEKSTMLSAFLQERARLKKNDGDWTLQSPLRRQSYLHKGLYCAQLENLYRTIPSEQILVLYQEDLNNKHQQTLKHVFNFLKLEAYDIPAETVFSGTEKTLSFTDKIAKFYATLYFWLHGENKKAWGDIIQRASKN